MVRFTRAALGSAALAILNSVCAAVDYGRTTGSFSVSPGGAASYTIPIWTPPGPNGLQPSIALSYSSQGGNGLGGVGWSLAAVSSIERCGRTGHQDGAAAPVALTTSDRFCLGGNRLRLASGTYGSAGSVYYTEFADYSRITAYGAAGNGPEYFVVEAKSGLKYEFGATANSRVLLGTTALRWMLNKVYDRNDNNYIVSYNNTTGFAVPDVISWTPTYLGSPNFRYEAKFNYINTRTDQDSYLGKVAGFDVANRYRLENIQIKSAGVVKRKYRFAYETSAATSRSRLTSAKECADDAESNCFLPLTFGYQSGQVGVTNAASAGATGSSLKLGKYDFNGDGRSDLLFVAGSTWKVAFSTGTGVGTPVDTGVSSSATFHVQRFLANHQDGLLVNVSGTWNYVGYNGSSFVSASTGTPVNSSTYVTDNNGDGIADLVWASGGSVMLRLNTTAGAASVPSFGSAMTAASFNVGQGSVSIMDVQSCPIERKCDLNGDGRADLMVNVHAALGCGIGGCSHSDARYDLLASGAGYSVGLQNGPISYTGVYFNDDRCVDRLDNGSLTLLISGCNGGTPTSITRPGGTPIDWNGDRKTDMLVGSGGFFGVYLATGSPSSPYSSLTTTSVPYPTGCFIFIFDLDGDGFDDVGCVGVSSPYELSYYTHAGSGGPLLTQRPDLLSSITDGFGVNISPSYVSTSQSNYTRGTGTQLPLVDVIDPIVVVSQVTSSNGVGGTFTKTYSYVGARENRERAESAGFQRIDEVDSRNNLVTRTYFEQTFPVTGMVSQTELMQPGGTTTIAREVFINSFTILDNTANNRRYFTYTSGSTATQYEVGGTWNSALLRTVTTANAFDTASGTLYDRTVTTTEPASGANGVTGGGSWVTRTYSPLANLLNDTTNWCLGRPQQTQAINSSNLTYGTQLTRTTNLTWNATYCRPTQAVAEPGSGTLQVTTAIGYDGFGNVNSTTVTGVGMTARTTSAAYSDATFTTGQFPLSVTNALSQTSTAAWDYDLGVPQSATDPNNLSVYWQYDAFGRRTSEDRPNGTATTWAYNNCSAISGGCLSSLNKAAVFATALDTGGSYINDELIYLDQFDRPITSTTRTLSGSNDRTNREYDSLGRLYRESAPCIWASCTTYWTTNTYDIANRPTAVSRPISDTNSTLQTTNIYYEGLTTRVVDPQSKQSSKVANSAGQLARSVDHNGYYQSFDYDAFGGVKRVTDQPGNTLQSSTYNLRGMLTQRVDMDMGTWNFMPNALGETVSQTDAKSQSATFVFDLLGRLTSRTEAEGTSTWTWGTSSASKNIGQLASVSGPGYSETYTYDSVGRPSVTSISADTSYQIDYSYNSLGALDTLTYPTSTSSYRLKLKYDYQYGQRYRIRECATTACTTFGPTYWTANANNGRNQVTQETLGNGLVTNRAYDAVTGWVKSIQTGVSGGSTVQNLAYTWDLAGNLASRKDVNQSNLTESFVYDNLYRLDYSQRNSVTNLDMAYDALGNITSKSDVGTYTYHAINKHQVTSTSNGWSFVYDNNGNMTSGRGATLTWTSYNYVASIANGTDTATFSYTPGRQYWKQISNYTTGGAATTIYVGGILEKVTASGNTGFRHMIRAGGSTIIVSRQSSGSNSVYYLTRDHLGSSSAISNDSGGVLVNSSFDAFGKRRGSNWTGNPSSADWTALAGTTRRGYTDHTMLDNVNLIQMNGRVQDPVLGRFASADPYITEPGFTQNYNRYSYVYNNPLTFRDPSGFGCEGSSSSGYSYDNYDNDNNRGYQNGSSTAAGAAAAAAECMEEVVVTGVNSCDAACQAAQANAFWNSYVDTLNLGQGSPNMADDESQGGSSAKANEQSDQSKECTPPPLDTSADRAYDPSENNYHEYDVESLAGYNLTPQQIQRLFDFWRNSVNAAPGAPANTPDYTPVLLGHMPGTPDTNWVYMRTGNLSWTNVTLPGHRYHPGVVQNSVVTSNGFTWLVSVGTGTTSNGRENMVLGSGIFKWAHWETIDRFYDGKPVKHAGGPFGGPGSCSENEGDD
jgi:RHS repeat-associated protein